MVRVFVTGVTGYIGGDALHAIAEAHPELDFHCLVRSKEKGELVASKIKTAHFVYGDLDDATLLEEEASKADIVCHWASCAHLGAAQALAAGVSKRSGKQPSYLIHTSGSYLLAFTDLDSNEYGIERPKVYDDWDGLDDVISISDTAPHKDVNAAILSIDPARCRTAIVCPPTIYGPGRGPGNGRSIQAPELASKSLERGRAFSVGKGRNIWSTVHIHDLSDLFLRLFDAALQGAGAASWGHEGFYFAEAGEVAWGDVAKEVASQANAKGHIQKTDVEELSAEEADKVWQYSSCFLGTNSRCKAIRARKLLGWEPKGPGLLETIERVVAEEAGS